MGFPVALAAAFSFDRRVYRAFGHLLAAGDGTLLIVPMAIANGDLRGVVDHCPVPWPEAWAVMDTEVERSIPMSPEVMRTEHPALAEWSDTGWGLDFITLGNSPRPKIPRLCHESGVRFAQVG